MKSFRINFVTLVTFAALSACASDGLDVSTEYLVPAGSNASFVSNTIPTTLAPGERRVVSVTVQNTGTTPGTNDWTVTSPPYALYRQGTTDFGWTTTSVPSLTTVGSSATFTFAITAPSAPGSYTFGARMNIRSGGGFFGPTLSVPITVSAAATPFYACLYEAGLSSVPTTLAPNANHTVTLAIRNTGSQAWAPASFYLRNRTSLWNKTLVNLTSPVSPGAVGTFVFSIRAPTTTGSQPFVWDMFQDGGGVGFFGLDCVNLSINVGGSPELDSAVVSNTFPATPVAPSEARSVSVTFQNTGTQTWTAGTAFALDAGHAPADLLGSGSVRRYLTTAVAPGASGTFTFTIRAPATPNTYNIVYRLRKMPGASDSGPFGATFSTTLVVDGTATPTLGCMYVPGSSSVPTSVVAGSTHTVTLAVQNTGSQTWAAGTVQLRSTNTPTDRWGPVLTATFATAVAPTQVATFMLTITAPTTPGATPFVWDAYESGGGGAGFFGGNCVNLSIAVTPATRDLLAGADRTVSGGGGIAPVTIGDVNDDSVPDVLVGRQAAPTGVARVRCGAVYGFIGGSGFFTGTNTAVPSDASFSIVGAEAGDQLAVYSLGNLIVGDVTGDGVDDIIVSSPDADGPSNARTSAGDVYVIRGSLGLSTAGTIDLGAASPSTHLAATIYGATAGDRLRPIAVGDLTGDGFNDLVLGAPQTGDGASNVGVAYIIVGTASGVPTTLDLAAPGATVVHTITGVVSPDRIGGGGAIGNFTGDANLDLLLGSPEHLEHATRDGAAYGFTGPITSSRSITAANIKWVGSAATVGLGVSVAVGDVRGTTSADVVLGAYQFRETVGGDQAGAVLVFDGPIAPGTYDLSLSFASTSARIIGADHGDNFGIISRLADVNGDGRNDVVVGARTASGAGNTRSRSGEVIVVLGGTTLSGVIDVGVTFPAFTIYGPEVDGLTASYANALSADDIDGDGRADICVGSHKSGRVDCIRSPF